MHYINPQDRNQLSFATSLNTMIAEDHPVRVLDSLIDNIVKSNADKFADKGQSEIGRRAYNPSLFLKLYLYGYINGISTSRKLEAETHRNIEVIWLLGNLKPDHKSISDYRKDNRDQIRFVTIEFRKFLKAHGYIKGKIVAVDGAKIKANANREMLTMDKINKRMKAVDKQLDEYLKKLQENDIKDDLTDELDEVDDVSIDTHLIDKIAKLQKKVEELEEQKKILEQEKRNSYSPTDPDARLMKTRNGKVPAYNTQYATDEAYHMIALAEVETAESDVNLLNSVIEKMEEQIDMIPDATLADKGYYKLTEIKKTETKNKTNCYVAVPEESQKKKDQTAGISFVYDKEKDEYKCSQGKRLVLKQKNKKLRSRLAEVYQGIECEGCSIKKQCTKSKYGRIINRYHDQEWADAYRTKLKSQKGKTMVKLRKNIVEHPFGTMSYWMGKIPLLLRGKSKVQAEIDIYSTGYNLTRLKNIEKTDNIIRMIEKYDWRAAA